MDKVLTKAGTRSRQWRERHRAAGMCIVCGQRPPENNREKCRQCYLEHKTQNEVHRQQVKDAAFAAYGGYSCACCHESFSHEFMCIDHMDGKGSKHVRGGRRLKGTELYRWLRINGYPAGFQVLCASCNQAKGTNTECPHATERQRMLEAIAKLPLTY